MFYVIESGHSTFIIVGREREAAICADLHVSMTKKTAGTGRRFA